MNRLGRSYTHDLPRLLKELRWLLLVVFGLYLAGCVAGYRAGTRGAPLPARAEWILPLAGGHIWSTRGWLHCFGPNTLKAVYSFLWGAVSLGLLALNSVWVNGCSTGWAVAAWQPYAEAATGAGMTAAASGVLLPHGPPEDLAFLLMQALGLRAGLVWIRPLPGLCRWESAKTVLRQFPAALLAVVPLLLVAALLETYTNPFFRDRYLLGIGASPAMAHEHRLGRAFTADNATLSPNGKAYATMGTFGGSIWLWTRSGAPMKIETGDALILPSLSWSRNGRRLVFIKGFEGTWWSELDIVDIAARRTHPVPNGPEGRYQQAAWHPRGGHIGVSVMRREPLPRATDLWLVDPVAGQWKQVTHLPGYGLDRGGFSWSPDGKQIAVARRRKSKPYSAQLWVMNAAGTGLRKLTDGPRDSRPAWSPDGKWIAFLAEPPGTETEQERFTDPLPLAQICLVRPDGSGRRDGLAKADPSSTLSWSPDGKQLLYVRHLTAMMGAPKGL